MPRRRSLAIAVVAALLALGVAGFLGEPAPTSITQSAARTVSTPLVDLEAVASTTAPRLDALDGRLRLLTPKTPAPAVLLFGATLALAARGYVRRHRPADTVSLPAWSVSLRGPPRLAAL